HGVILRHPPPSGCELWLNSPDLDAFSLFHQLPDTTGVPPDYLIEQIAASLKLPPEVLYFWARRMTPDVVPTEYIDAAQIVTAFRLFRAALKRDSGRPSTGVAR
ncbi:MAG TPA: hypothetical protein VKS22_04795, partial [Candidatus Binataceae bacterium]|nr:hypothetical protein [Candidatus Binataceae bacterium]